MKQYRGSSADSTNPYHRAPPEVRWVEVRIVGPQRAPQRLLVAEMFQLTGVVGGAGRAEDDTEVKRPPVHLQGFGRRRLPGVPVADQLDPDEQAGTADVANEPVAGLHLPRTVVA
jgi:hypothetical protein